MDNSSYIAFDELKKLYPNEWVLLGDPEMKNTSVLGGIVLYHSKDKKKFAISAETKPLTIQRLQLLLRAT